LITTSLAIGSLVGSFLVEPLEKRLGRANLLAVSMFAMSWTLLIPVITTSIPVIFVVWALSGAIGIGWNVVTVSLRQRIVPDALLGRLNASYRLLAWGTMPLGAFLGGLVGEWFGVAAVLWIFGLLNLGLLLGRLVVTDEAIARAEAEGEAARARAAAAAAGGASAAASDATDRPEVTHSPA
jgi:MFS family permease